MKSYILAITVTMFLSALFAFQNIGDVTVKFLIFEKIFPQGVWEVFVFSAGAAIMWVFSIFSIVEVKNNQKDKIKKVEEKVTNLENENKKLLETIVLLKSATGAENASSEPTVDENTNTNTMAE